MDIRNKKLSDDEFYGIRKEVMEQWPTGKEVNFEEAIDSIKRCRRARAFHGNWQMPKKREKH